MPWVKFTAPFDFHVRHNVTISYKADVEYLVKRVCAEQAIKAGKAVPVERAAIRGPTKDVPNG